MCLDSLLGCPNFGDACGNADAGLLYKNQGQAAFNAVAKEWTTKYAK